MSSVYIRACVGRVMRRHRAIGARARAHLRRHAMRREASLSRERECRIVYAAAGEYDHTLGHRVSHVSVHVIDVPRSLSP